MKYYPNLELDCPQPFTPTFGRADRIRRWEDGDAAKTWRLPQVFTIANDNKA
jgi:hypothetical protein